MPTDGAQQTGWSIPHEHTSERAERGPGSQLTIDSNKIQRALDETSRRRESEKTLRNARGELARASHLTVMASLAASIAQPTPDQRRLERRRCDPVAESSRA